jgi:prophage antirepressor-like protein
MTDITKIYEGKTLRTVLKDGEVLFCLSDVGRILELSNAYRQVKDDAKGVHTVHTLTPGGSQDILFISEPVLYRLIFKSKKKEAKKFQDWIFEEVLPSIRKTGEYRIPKSLKEKSTQARNLMTDTWKENGISKPEEYAYLTLEEYRLLQIEKGKRKKDFSKSELLTLYALESLEALNLHYNPVNGYIECRESLTKTSRKVLEIEKSS